MEGEEEQEDAAQNAVVRVEFFMGEASDEGNRAKR